VFVEKVSVLVLKNKGLIMLYDAVILGGGLSGLISGSLLSIDKKKILILDKNDNVGGASGSFDSGGVLLEKSLHNFGDFSKSVFVYAIFEKLNLTNILEFTHYDNYQKLIFPGYEICPEKGFNNLIELLKKKFPAEEIGLKKLSKVTAKVFKEFEEIEKLSIPIHHIEEKVPNFPLLFPNIIYLSNKTLKAFFDDYINDEKLKGVLSNLWWLFGMDINKLSAVLYLAPFFNYFEFAGGVFKGGSQVLIDKLVEKVKTSGSEIKENSKVISVSKSNEKWEIECEDGRKYYSKNIISTIGLKNFINVSKDAVSELEIYKDLDDSLSAISLWIVTKKTIDTKHHSISFFSSFDQQENYKYSFENDFHKSSLLISIPTINDNLISKDKTVINALTLINDKKDFDKTLSLETLKERVCKIIGISINDIDYVQIAYPEDIERFTGTKAIYGINQTIDFSGVNRLSVSCGIDNLYFAGKDCFPGAGYPSVIYSGYLAYKELKENM